MRHKKGQVPGDLTHMWYIEKQGNIIDNTNKKHMGNRVEI